MDTVGCHDIFGDRRRGSLGHGKIVRRDLSAQKFEPQVAQRNRSAERPTKLRLERGPELITLIQKRHADHRQYQYREEDSNPLCNGFHRRLLCGDAMSQMEKRSRRAWNAAVSECPPIFECTLA